GHLVGLSVGLAMLIGISIAWLLAVPLLTAATPQTTGDLGAFVNAVWSSQVRFLGAGAMAVAAIWSLARMLKPIAAGLIEVIGAQKQDPALLEPTDRDLSMRSMVILVVICALASALLVWRFASVPGLEGDALILALASLPIL